MQLSQKLRVAWKALQELGLQRVSYYALYQLELRSGYLGWRTRDGRQALNRSPDAYAVTPILRLPNPNALVSLLGEDGCAAALAIADEVVSGKVRLFGGDPMTLHFESPSSQRHWTELERGKDWAPGKDIRLTWEMGRFGWVYPLGRAYRISGDERYAACFWEYTEKFLGANPPYHGEHWMSGQEAAIRLIGLFFGAQVFSRSVHSTQARMLSLGRAISDHASRIPPSLTYALAQGNNHLLVEAAGLYTAGCALPAHPEARSWRELGWRWMNRGLVDQIAPDGAYVQNSANYHRLMLQTALWVHSLASAQGDQFLPATSRCLAAATNWLSALLDPESGKVPNLGPNDGAYILPLSGCAFQDYRPVLQASARAFVGGPILEEGLWDEMGMWLGGEESLRKTTISKVTVPDKLLVLNNNDSWAYLRAARFKNRPGHADQLHLELWWRGQNVALDAGTYLYNAEPPWDNGLARSLVHNTVTVNGLDQMTRAGRFLWLDWAQASGITHEKAVDGSWQQCAAEHNGYRRLDLLHRRAVTAYREGGWLVEDCLTGDLATATGGYQPLEIRLHWLLPDWEWAFNQTGNHADLKIESLAGRINLLVSWSESLADPVTVQLVRAGELLSGSGAVSPLLGWFSPTYGVKLPALSYSITLRSGLPCVLSSEWRFSQKPG